MAIVDEADPPLRYSIVVPVFNESANIGTFCRQARSLAGLFELLVCYDFPEDDTLTALAELPPHERPSLIRPVHNTLGKGVRYAIEAGMRAARAPVVVVMMADVSDDFTKVEEMVRRVEAGSAVCCGSRYMPGGRQIGGPWFKGLLSRAAGLSLHRLTGLPTRDPTNSFKAYSKAFLDRVKIESKAGFCLGMEITIKAHFAGARVEEVPATWYDRAAGTSRFRLFRWLPSYLRWYAHALRRAWW